jgi:hypothetical protein
MRDIFLKAVKKYHKLDLDSVEAIIKSLTAIRGTAALGGDFWQDGLGGKGDVWSRKVEGNLVNELRKKINPPSTKKKMEVVEE